MAYGIHRMDPVIILGQFGVLFYTRNLLFIHSEKQKLAIETGSAPAESAVS